MKGEQRTNNDNGKSVMARITDRVCDECDVLFYEEEDLKLHKLNIHEDAIDHIISLESRLNEAISDLNATQATMNDTERELAQAIDTIKELEREIEDLRIEREQLIDQIEELKKIEGR